MCSGACRLEEVVDRLETAGIAYGRMNSVPEFLEHPQLTARSRWTEIGSEVGPLRALRPPVEMEGVEPVMGDVPALGQHTVVDPGGARRRSRHDRRLEERGNDSESAQLSVRPEDS